MCLGEYAAADGVEEFSAAHHVVGTVEGLHGCGLRVEGGCAVTGSIGAYGRESLADTVNIGEQVIVRVAVGAYSLVSVYPVRGERIRYGWCIGECSAYPVSETAHKRFLVLLLWLLLFIIR